MIDYRPSYESSFEAAVMYLRRASWFLRFVKVGATVVGAILIAVSPWLAQQDHANANFHAELSLWVGLVLTGVGSVVLIFVDQTTPEVLEENLRLARQAEVNEEAFQYLLDYIDHTLTRVSLNTYLREVVEKAVSEGCKDHEQLQRYCSAIIGFLEARKAALFDIGDEQWNFAVYRFVEESGKLECVAWKRAFDDPPDHRPRSWSRGEGHVGLAFDRKTDLIFADATSEELRPVIGATGANERPYDLDRYKSLAAMPIYQEPEVPLGILIATSDQRGRFKSESERKEEDWEREDALREAAGYLAIIFGLMQNFGIHGGTHDAQEQ